MSGLAVTPRDVLLVALRASERQESIFTAIRESTPYLSGWQRWRLFDRLPESLRDRAWEQVRPGRGVA